MKGLLLKTFLVVLAVTVTGILAWAQDSIPTGEDKDATAGLNRDRVYTEADFNGCTKCAEIANKRMAQARLTDNTNPKPRVQEGTPNAPATNKTNVESSGGGGE